MNKIKTGSKVSVNYTGRLEDGTVFDSSLNEGRTPLSVTIGNGELIKGFEDGLIDMSEGEKKTVTIPSEFAYGDYRGELISDVKLDMLPTDVKVGDELVGESDMGPIRVKVMEINEGMASLDANHPLAGKTLIFDLDVISVD
jgi:FKBP-type peptidyl-prolyl cis-trans isomerase 2